MKFYRNEKGELVRTEIGAGTSDASLPSARLHTYKDGYTARVVIPPGQEPDEATYEAFLRLGYPYTREELVIYAQAYALEVLQEERIFDWSAMLARQHELDPATAAACRIMSCIEWLTRLLRESTPDERHLDELAMCAWDLGRSFEALMAQLAWSSRNPPPTANAKKKAKVQSRREMLADYIRDHGERSDKRPGAWYTGFREAYPQHKEVDRTLKADYPHALALSRKRAKSR